MVAFVGVGFSCRKKWGLGVQKLDHRDSRIAVGFVAGKGRWFVQAPVRCNMLLDAVLCASRIHPTPSRSASRYDSDNADGTHRCGITSQSRLESSRYRELNQKRSLDRVGDSAWIEMWRVPGRTRHARSLVGEGWVEYGRAAACLDYLMPLVWRSR